MMRERSQNVEYTIRMENETVVLYYNGKKLFIYNMMDSLFKPYIKELYTPAGHNILLDSPDDHKHHHGLMLAYNVDGINFWEETNNSGRQKSIGISKLVSSTGKKLGEGGFATDIHWIDPGDGSIILREVRTINGEYNPRLEVNLYDWESRFLASDSKPSGSVAGSHYDGLGMRFVRSMDNAGEFVSAENKAGDIFRGQERLITDRWCAYLSQVDNQKVTVAMLAHPDNPGGLTTWFTMKVPFAYMSATMRLHENPMALQSGEILSLGYGVALWDGHVDNQRIEEAYQYWLTHITNREGK